MAKRKSDDPTPPEDADLMAVVEATEPVPPPAPEPAPKPEPVMEAPLAPPPPPAPRGGGFGTFVGLVLGGAVAAGAGFGLARYMPDLLPVGGDASLAATVQAQAEELAALREQLAALPAKTGGDVEQRLAALEQAAPADPSATEARLAEVEAKLAEFSSAPADGSAPAALVAEVNTLKEQVAQLGTGGTVPADVTAAAEAAEARLREAEARAAAMAEQAETAATAARRAAALDRIAAALDSGAPFAAALTDLGGEAAPVLADHAAAGLPTVKELHDSFPDAARDALEAALRANMGESWTDRVSNFLRSQTGLRSLTPRDGDDPDAILSRAEAALAAGDVAGAVKELDAMPEAGKPALSDWLAQAQLRVEAEAAFAALAQN